MTSLLFFSRELAETFMELQENSVAGFCCKAISFQRINVPDACKLARWPKTAKFDKSRQSGLRSAAAG